MWARNNYCRKTCPSLIRNAAGSGCDGGWSSVPLRGRWGLLSCSQLLSLKETWTETPDCEGEASQTGWRRRLLLTSLVWGLTGKIITIGFLCCLYVDWCIGEKALMALLRTSIWGSPGRGARWWRKDCLRSVWQSLHCAFSYGSVIPGKHAFPS